ncbi:osteopetrosis-associated transmembrane protein 1-like [Saccostrea echinata]|uniref:osteopetrosis-associated transmembrane protein 1-like n=1 Tax=Saccostrea echinata TaxID=191078 RepID=UPI002A829B57|nr:osteopetrosis-associated transmembrane protein 1-like [Saccostrea echinata]
MYLVLNDHYEDMRTSYKGKICMDLVDMMNYTRLMWGDAKDLNCTKHDRDDMPVLLTSIILLTIPFLFYGATCICGERKKLKIMTQKRLKNPISVEVSRMTSNSNSNHVNSIS